MSCVFRAFPVCPALAFEAAGADGVGPKGGYDDDARAVTRRWDLPASACQIGRGSGVGARFAGRVGCANGARSVGQGYSLVVAGLPPCSCSWRVFVSIPHGSCQLAGGIPRTLAPRP